METRVGVAFSFSVKKEWPAEDWYSSTGLSECDWLSPLEASGLRMQYSDRSLFALTTGSKLLDDPIQINASVLKYF